MRDIDLATDEHHAQIRSMSAVVRWLLISQLVLGVAWLFGSISVQLTTANLPIVLGLALAAVNIPTMARLAAFELQRTIVDYQRQAVPEDDADSRDQLKVVFERLKVLRRSWVGRTGVAFIGSAGLATATVIISTSLPSITILPLAILWALAAYILLRLCSDVRTILSSS